MSDDAVSFKLVVTGPFGAGKTTLISAVSEVPVVATEVNASSAEESARKSATTVSMDFGMRTVAEDGFEAKLLVYGTPGQERFSFMWDVLARGMDGFLLLVDSTDRASWPTARLQLEHFRAAGPVPHLVAANRAVDGSPVLKELAAALGSNGTRVLACDVTDLESAKSVVVELLCEVLEALLAPTPPPIP
ncbi:MAG TPA: ATP/GTP-binding protein [Acidimicrobiales bacterium]|nr:ATP/GTP-binding protein [Acidimicrobiales bacterium]